MRRRLIIFAALLTLAVCGAYAAEEAEALLVYVTPKGGKYHLSDCRYVKGRTDTTAYTVAEAKAKGYQPCKVCNPPEE